MNSADSSVAPPLPNVPPPRRRRWWLKLLLMLVIFLSGLLIGAGVATVSLRNRVLEIIHHPERAPAKIAASLGKQFKWRPEQVQQVEQVIQVRQKNLTALRCEVQPRVVVELKQLEDEVARLLDEPQQNAWHAACTKQLHTWVPELAPNAISPENVRP